MNPEKLAALTQLLLAFAAVAAPITGAYIATLRYRLNRARLERGEAPEKVPDIVGPAAPLILLLFGGALLGYLLAQHPGLARLPLPAADAAAQAKVGPPAGVTYCTRASDCGSGCSCDRGQCRCSADRPKTQPPQRQHPRLVADLSLWPLGDCLALPQMMTAIRQPY